MDKPSVRTENARQSNKSKDSQYGYDVTDSKDAIDRGLKKASSLVRDVKKSGEEIRSWAKGTSNDTSHLIKKLSKSPSPTSAPKKNTYEVDKRIWEIAYWENEISRKIRVYFSDISKLMSELQKLNPPLQSQHLEPYLSDILSDRRMSLMSLEPITKNLEELHSLKSRLYLEKPQKFNLHEPEEV